MNETTHNQNNNHQPPGGPVDARNYEEFVAQNRVATAEEVAEMARVINDTPDQRRAREPSELLGGGWSPEPGPDRLREFVRAELHRLVDGFEIRVPDARVDAESKAEVWDQAIRAAAERLVAARQAGGAYGQYDRRPSGFRNAASWVVDTQNPYRG